MRFEHAIRTLEDELKEQEDWYEGWKTTTTKGSSLPGKEEQIEGLKEAIRILKNCAA